MSYIFSYLKSGFDIFQKENKICNFPLKFVGIIKQKLVTPERFGLYILHCIVEDGVKCQ